MRRLAPRRKTTNISKPYYHILCRNLSSPTKNALFFFRSRLIYPCKKEIYLWRSNISLVRVPRFLGSLVSSGLVVATPDKSVQRFKGSRYLPRQNPASRMWCIGQHTMGPARNGNTDDDAAGKKAVRCTRHQCLWDRNKYADCRTRRQANPLERAGSEMAQVSARLRVRRTRTRS